MENISDYRPLTEKELRSTKTKWLQMLPKLIEWYNTVLIKVW